MRTLNRPMFNMGGPIKEGVMHGIREPYKGGQLVRPGPGRPGYQGDPRKGIAKRVGAWGASKIPGFTKGWAKRAWDKYKFPPKMQPATPTGPGITTATKAKDMWHRAGQYFGKHPYLSTLGPAYLSQTQPVQSVAKGVVGAIPEIAQFGTEVLTPKKWEKYLPPDDWWKWKSDVEWKPGDVRGETPPPDKTLLEKIAVKDYGPHKKDTSPILTKSMRDKVAQTAKDRRVNELLEMMGHKQSKKDAVYDALIDASQIVGAAPGGKGLDISKDIIQPIIGATSKRFDKPKEIEEAVRLMMTKGEIEKDIAAGKGGTLKQNAKDLVNAGVFKDETAAMKHLASKKTMGSVVADVSKQFGVSGANADVLDTSLRIKEEVIPEGKWKGDNKVYKEFKNNNKDKADIELEFVKTITDRKVGDYYIVDKRIVLVDENLNPDYYY